MSVWPRATRNSSPTSTVAPGLTSQITISVNKGDSSTEPLPVLDGTLPAYQGVLSELKAAGS